MIEAQEQSKKEMLKVLEGEDISHIDVDTDEGKNICQMSPITFHSKMR